MKLLLPYLLLICFSFTGYKCAAQSTSNSSDKICDNPLCIKYYNIWKTIFLKRNGMSEEYFNKHVQVTGDWIDWRKYQYVFNINYNITIDWETSKTSDMFVIKTNNPPNPAQSFYNDNYLGLEEVVKVLEDKHFGGHISKRPPDEHLKYASRESALDAGKNNVAGRKMTYGGCDVRYDPYKDTLGHPVLYCRFNLTGGNTFGEFVDLVTGHITVPEQQNTICDSPLCVKYYNIWKSIFLKRNGMSEEYFKYHIEVQGDVIRTWKTGASFAVHYVTTIDWASCNGDDKFIIKTDSKSYPNLYLNPGCYLSQDEIERAVGVDVFDKIGTRKSIEHLKFATQEAALQAARERVPGASTGYEGNNINYPDGRSPSSGHAVMYFDYHEGNNKCFLESLDLVTGEIEIKEVDCIIE